MKDHNHAPTRKRRWPALVLIALLALASGTSIFFALRKADEKPRGACSTGNSTMSFLGDSYVNGAGTDSGAGSRFPALVAKHYGVRAQILGYNGSGYVARGPAPYDTTFPEAAARVLPTTKFVVVLGSRNDTAPASAVYQAALRTFSTIKTRAPGAEVLVVGPPWINSKPTPQMFSNRNAVRDAARKASLRFVDPLQDGWFSDDAADGKSPMIASDHIHPNDRGHAYIATKIESAIGQNLCGANPR